MSMRYGIFIVAAIVLVFQNAAMSADDINQKAARLDMASAGLEEVIAVFGPPQRYIWGNKTFTRDTLPESYVACLEEGFCVYIRQNKVVELRFEGQDTGFRFGGKLGVGSTLEEALDVLGPPEQTLENQGNGFADKILYKDIDGQKGHCYYHRSDKNIRLFFADYKIVALYITRMEPVTASSQKQGFQVEPVDVVKPYMDVRQQDLRKILTPAGRSLVRTLSFNGATVWPEFNVGQLPLKEYVNKLVEDAKNPGLGVRKLHQQGITGKGVTVAIIDQPLYLNHPEFEGKIIEYHDVGCGGSQSSMHGPSVASLLAGTHCGTAPEVKMYYAAAPSWTKDTAFQAAALDWLIEKNKQLPVGQKIRVVSVSGAPSGPGSPFEKNTEQWDMACHRAEAAGMMVLDCTQHHGFISSCYFYGANVETPIGCKPGFPNSKTNPVSSDDLYVPTCPRTSAEQYTEDQAGYAYWGQGGLSWAIPYCAGVLAMGWQVSPKATPEQMKELLLKTAYQTKEGANIIDPSRFIQALQKGR